MSKIVFNVMLGVGFGPVVLDILFFLDVLFSYTYSSTLRLEFDGFPSTIINAQCKKRFLTNRRTGTNNVAPIVLAQCVLCRNITGTALHPVLKGEAKKTNYTNKISGFFSSYRASCAGLAA